MPLRVTAAAQTAAPSNLAVILRAIVEGVGLAGNASPVLVGRHYLSADGRGMGASPSVILIPEPRDVFRYESPYEAGRAAKQVHECDVIVRAAETGDDITRHAMAYDLSDLVLSIVRRVCTGRLTIGTPIGSYPSPTTSDMVGVSGAWSFTYDRDIRPTEAVATIAPSATNDDDAQPWTPPGAVGSLEDMTATITEAS